MRFLYVLLISLLLTPLLQAKITPSNLTCEYLNNPLVVDVSNPRLSWMNIAGDGERGQVQTAWEVRVASIETLLMAGKADLWNSGKVISRESVNNHYNGKPLSSRQDCWWQVRVWDKNGRRSGWSEPAFWAMGLLDQSDWEARWIGAPWQGEEALPKPSNPGAKLPEQMPPPAPMFRKGFNISKKVKRAVAYVTGLGYFELYLNGKKVSDDVLVPNQTNYGKRPGLLKENIPLEDDFREYKVMYLAYDVKDLLKDKENAVGAIIGNGFYNPAKYWTGSYGSPRFLVQLYIDYDDGSQDVIFSNNTWKVSKSPVLMDMVYYGEHYDARLEQPGWCESGFDESAWDNAVIRKAPEGVMRAHMANPDRVMEILDPEKIEKLDEGHYKIDFGQEISGWVRLKNITGEAGRKIDIRYLHPYSPNGENTYTLSGNKTESYSARFTWFVFREVEISGWPGDLKPESIQAEAVYTDVTTTGKFECSNPLLNDINRIWWRSQTDNMHGGVASDCPNRERSPYTGDGQVACVTVIHNFDSRAFYNKWIHDIIGASNEETGYVPNGAPWQPGCGGGVAWGAAISIMPWEFYLHYGDIDILRDSYDAMNKRTMPSYGYWLEQGATTSWENWDRPGSGNHPMFGGGLVWLYRRLAGMNADPENPGYRNIIFCSDPVNDITFASYSNLTPYGMASIKWRRESGKFFTEIDVPVGSTAVIHVPANDPASVKESGVEIGKKSGIKLIGSRDGYAVYTTGSGEYKFISN